MRFIVVGGFLGAGKTSLISALARVYKQSGRRVTVLENEAGRAGFDSRLLTDQGVEVERMLGGCACCDLLPLLMGKIGELARRDKDGLVLFEPSGVAALDSLLADLVRHAPQELNMGVVVVMDSTRFEVMRRAMAGLLAGQLNATRMVVLSKVDIVSGDELEKVMSGLRESAPCASIWPANLSSPDGVWIAEELARVLESTKVAPALLSSQDSPYQVHFWELRLAPRGLESEMALIILDALIRITDRALGRGMAHVKLVGRDHDGCLFFASGTSAGDLRLRGSSRGPIQEKALCEVIAFGRPSVELSASLVRALESFGLTAC